ncbi:MAG: hypothetical protein ABR915_00240 [Thermoguttaceae bacterium]|jgi:hypothetical protein
MAFIKQRPVFWTLALMLGGSVALAGDPAIERVIGPVQGRSGPPYVEATGRIDIGCFQQEQKDKLQTLLDGLAAKSEMNPRVLKNSVNSKMCQLTKTSKPSMKAVAQLFQGSTAILITVKKNGGIEIKGTTAQPKGSKK